MRRRGGKVKAVGGYSKASVAAGSLDHDGQGSLYFTDKDKSQTLRDEERKQRRKVALDDFSGVEEKRWLAAMPKETELAINIETMSNRDGGRVSADDRKATIDAMIEDRSWYYRRDGKPQRLRSRTYAMTPDKKFVRDAAGKKVRVELPEEKVPVVFHDSFQLDPRISITLVEAFKAGCRELVTRFVQAGARDVVELFEAFTKLEVIGVPFHAGYLASHFQPDFVVVSKNHLRLGLPGKDGRINSETTHLAKKMAALDRWRRMGIPPREVEGMTPHGGYNGLDDAMEDRGDVAVDRYVESGLDKRMLTRLEEPEYAALKPFWNDAVSYYSDYLRRRTEAVFQADALERAEAEKAEAVKLAAEAERLRKEGADSRIAAEERAAKADAERTASEERAAKAEAEGVSARSQVIAGQRHLGLQNLRVLAAEKRAKLRVVLRELAAGQKVAVESLRDLQFDRTGKFIGGWETYRLTLLGPTPSPATVADVEELGEMLAARSKEGVSTPAHADPVRELADLRAKYERVCSELAEVRSDWKTWPVEILVESILRVAEGKGRGADDLLLDQFDRVSPAVRDYLGDLRDRGGNEEVHAREAEAAIEVHDQLMVDRMLERQRLAVDQNEKPVG